MSDGGRCALAGYLYQIVGTLGWEAHARSQWSGENRDSDELEGTLEVVRTAELSSEQFGQDAASFTEKFDKLGLKIYDQCVLIQFKYSRKPVDNDINPSYFNEIVKRLETSAQRAQSLGLSVTGYILVTNRSLSNETEKQRRLIQPELRVVKVSLDEWQEHLSRFAHEFGVIGREVEEGIKTLTSDLFWQTAKGDDISITEEKLIEAFTGHPRARRLLPQYVTEISQKQLNKFSEDKLSLRDTPIRRQVLDEITQAISERQALLVLDGLGGCGKTTTLWQWGQELRLSYPLGSGAFVEAWPANDIPYFWIAEVICIWGNISRHRSRSEEQPEDALNRLLLANPNISPPVMHLGLDGLDEEIDSANQRYAIKEALRWFWEEGKASRLEQRPPKAVLIVTCRDQQEFLRKWLPLGGSGFPYKGELPKVITIDEFSSGELEEAAQVSLSHEVYTRITSTLRIIDGFKQNLVANSYEILSFRAETPSLPSANEQVLESLKHPAMWRSFLEFDSKDQTDILDGNPKAIQRLAEIFISWFCEKTKIRNSDSVPKNLRDTLVEIAYHCENKEGIRQSRIHDWIEPACKACGISDSQANFIYNEAISAGIILEDDSNFWYWRHELVLEYLATLKGVR